jgi:hypothetical protein
MSAYTFYEDTGDFGWSVVADFQGGLIVSQYWCDPCKIVKLDGMTGQPYPVYTPTHFIAPDDTAWTVQGTNPYAILVAPDGTIFDVETGYANNADGSYVGNGTYVNGIDPTTGTVKFSVQVPQTIGNHALETPLATGPSYMIAGDGYAYIPYLKADYPGELEGATHLMLLRVNSSGNSDLIEVQDWASDPLSVVASMVTNADQGVVLLWISESFGAGMAVTTGASVSIVAAPAVAGQGTAIENILQAQDGSFIGAFGSGSPLCIDPIDCGPLNSMVAFDASGNVRWVVPNDQPQIATADGGVIGQSGITYDSNGNATGQPGGLPTYSWTGNAYQQQGSVEQISADLLFDLYDIATSFWAVAGGNYSDNATAYAVIRTFSDSEASSDITVSNFSQTGANQQTITNVLNDILHGLNSGTYASCGTWLTGASTISTSFYIANLTMYNLYGHGSFSNNDTAAFVGGTSTGVPTGVAIAVNDTGAFFNAKLGDKTFTVGRRAYTGGTLKGEAAILIHELGHLMNDAGGAAGFQPDAGNRKAGRANDKLVDKYCGKLIGGLR